MKRASLALARAALATSSLALLVVVTGCPAPVAAAKKAPPPSTEPPHFYADPPFGVGFDCIEIGCDVEKTLTIVNKGGGSLGISKVRTTVDTSTDFSVTRKDGQPLPTRDAQVFLAAGEELELLVRYRPTDGALDAGAVEMEHYDAAVAYEDSAPKTDEVPLTARAFGSPTAALDGDVLDFGYIPAGTEATLDLVVDNDGDAEVLTVGPAHREDGTPAVFHAPSPREWGLRFANPGEAAHIPVVFSPATADAFFGAVVLQTNDPALPGVRVAVQGTAIADARLAVIEPTDGLTMPPLRTGDTRTSEVVIRNLGGAPLDVAAAITAGAELGLSVDPPSITALAPLATATFHVTLTGVGGGFVDGNLELTDTTHAADPGAAAGAVIDVPVHGAVDAPFLSVTPEPVYFGDIVQTWTATPQAISISNTGFGDLTISSIAFELGSSSQVQLIDVPALPQKLSPGQDPIVVTVLMTAVNIGPVDATLLVGSDSIDDPVHRVDMHGSVITCDEGCPTQNGTPDCSTGSCQVGTCFAHFHDADLRAGNGCECAEDIVGNSIADIGGACPGLDLGQHSDNDGPFRRSGTLHDLDDVDLYFWQANDDTQFLNDDYGAKVRLVSGPPGLEVCANFQQDGNGCGGLPTNCSFGEIRGHGQSGIFGSSDNSEDITTWVVWAPGSNPVCGNYTLEFTTDGDF